MPEWFKANKKWFGGGLLGVFLYMTTHPEVYASYPWIVHAIGMLGAFLGGAGLMKSDSYYKDRKDASMD